MTRALGQSAARAFRAPRTVAPARTGGRARRVAQGAALLCACLLAAALAVALPGTVERYDGPAVAGAAAPRWAAPCARTLPRNDRVLLSRCARVEGRVLYVSREPSDTHLAVVAELHLFLVKLRPTDRAPGPGTKVSVVGPLMRADNGMREVQAAALEKA